jgi:DNA replication protein DnaC
MAEQIGKLIGKRKYQALKALDLENLTDETLEAFNLQFKNITVAQALKMIEAYETEYTTAEDYKKTVSEYFKKINQPKEKQEVKIMTKEWLWNNFSHHYLKNEGVNYSQDQDSIENIKPIIYYFIGDFENFQKCINVSKLSIPSFEKGLLIIGGYGNGKTSVMRAIELSLRNTNVAFKGYSANKIVSMYEACQNNFDKEEFYKTVLRGVRYFDDVLTEADASNYGKKTLFKDILEERNHLKRRTYITCNYAEGIDIKSENLLEVSLEQFATKYGSRVYDRLFSDFNIIEFKGKSFRR